MKPGVEQPGRPNCIARKDGDSFVISGQKAAWVSNGTIATAAALFTAVDMGDGQPGNGAFLVPLDDPGVSRGKPLDKIGQRALNQGEIFFDGVRIPANYMVVPPQMYPIAADMVLTQANGGMGVTFVGVARAALELAVDYAKERVQGGVPIIEHQSVKAAAVRDVPQGGGGAGARPAGGDVQLDQHGTPAALRDRFEGHGDEYLLRGRELGGAGLRGQRAEP